MPRGGVRSRAVTVASVAGAALLLLGGISGAATTPLPPQYGTGTDGTGPGEINSGEDVGLDRTTNEVYVPEDSNARVSVFNRDGSFARAFGYDVIPGGFAGLETCTAATGCQAGVAGGGPGQFDAALGIEIAPNRDVFVSDENNSRVNEFTPEGEFVRAFGKDVIPGGGTGFEVCTAVCQPGTDSDEAGALDQPWGMAISPENELYVTDTDNYRISVYTLEGQFLRSMGRDVIPGGAAGYETCTQATGCQEGLDDGSAGSFSRPEGLDFDLQGRLWIAEYDSNRVSVLGAGDEFLFAFGQNVDPGAPPGFQICTTSCQFASSGDAPGALWGPQSVEVDFNNTVYVADSINNRISVFTTAPAFLRAFGFDVIPGGDTGFEICTTNCQSGDSSSDPGAVDSPYGVEADCHGSVYTSEIDQFRVERFGEPGASTEPCAFALGKTKRNKRKGTAKLEVTVPEPGEVTIAGKKVKSAAKPADAVETLKLKIKPKRKTAKRLAAKGKAKVKLAATFDPTEAGEPETLKKKLKLIDR